MEINLRKLGEQAIESTTGSAKMRLSENASSMVFQLFTKNVYSNPIGTVVREIASNCFDSHTEAKVNAPVIIRKHKDAQTGTHYISFIDFGVGMSPDRVNNIYGVYFESTKRVDNTQIGGFGIGGKTPLAYKRATGLGEGEYDNSFYVITVFNKTKYYYCIYEGSESPVISLLHSESTTEGNGTEIRIPVLEKDLEKFQREMIRQLYYFENIIFEGFEYKDGNDNLVNPLPNDYNIINGKSFLFRGHSYSEYIHVCLGRVAYPIDYNVLGLCSDDYKLPIALKLQVGDLNVTVSRESIDYSESTVKMLKKKLEEVKLEIRELVTKQYENIVTLEQYFEIKNNYEKLTFPNGASMSVKSVIKISDIDFQNFRYSFMKMPCDKKLFNFFFDLQLYGKKPKKSRSRYFNSNSLKFEGGYESLKKNNNVLYIEYTFNRKLIKQSYLKETYETYYIIKKRNIVTNHMRGEISDVFNVHIDSVRNDKDEIISFVQTLLKIQEEYMEIVRKYIQNYDTLEIPEDFIASKRGGIVNEELRKQTISVKFMSNNSKERVELSTLFDYKMPIFYGTQEDENKLNDATYLFNLLFHKHTIVTHCEDNKLKSYNRYYRVKNVNPKKSIAFIMVAQGNVKYMKYCKNAKHVNEFFTGMLMRKENVIMEYFQTNDIISSFNELNMFYRNDFIDRVSEKWGKMVYDVKVFINNIPSKIMNTDLCCYNHLLLKHFKTNDIKKTKEQQSIRKMIEEIQELEKKNEKVLGYFNIPYEASKMENEQITLLQLAMSL